MSKKSDDSIDRIFRQALTQYDTKFHEDDWVKMEKLLNEEAQRKAAARSRRIKGTAYTLTGLTGLIIAVYFLAIKNPSGSIADLRDSVTEMQASEALTENGNVKLENPSEGLLSQSSPNASDKIAESETTSDNTNSAKGQPSKINSGSEDRSGLTRTDDQSLHQNRVNGNAYPNIESPATNRLNRPADEIEATPSGSFRNRIEYADKPGLDPSNESKPSLTQPDDAVNVQAVGDKLLKNDNARGHTYLKANSGESGKATLKNTNEANDGVTQQAKSTSGESLPNKSVLDGQDSSLVTAASTQKPLADSALVDDTIISKEKNTRSKGRLSIAFVIAPEFSTTSLSNYSSPGDSYGLRIGYQLTKRWSVQTGFIRSQKKYEGSGVDYKPRNPAYWQIRTNGVVPEEIYSKCLVYELPIGIQFDAIQTSKSRVFVSASTSSYFMISQAYDYTFQSPNPGADTGWRSRGSESYWFSVGMVSAGYERYLNRSLAIGIEPYLKISLAEIGWPKIKLYSTGAYVTLRYKFMGRGNF